MATENRTYARMLADQLLPDGGLEEFVRTRRAAGKSWRLIEHDLTAATNGQATVTSQTLRVWFADQLDSAAAS